MNPEQFEVLNTFYRTLIAFQSMALKYVAAGDGLADTLARAAEMTNGIGEARRPFMLVMECDCPSDRECCPGGGCAFPGCCGVPELVVAGNEQAAAE
jgi:hypothetical protein